MQREPMLYKSPWILQAWSLQIVYAFYFDDTAASGRCWAKHQSLAMVRYACFVLTSYANKHQHLRASCLMNEQLTLLGSDVQPWITDISSSLPWSSEKLSLAWQSFISQETYRHCVFAVLFLDLHMATPCNTRPAMSNVELGWDLPLSAAFWDAPSAEEWYTQVQEYLQQGKLCDVAGAGNLMSLARATQLLLSSSPPTRLLEQFSESPFAASCMLVSLQSLVRDFTGCYYRMPPVLPDPSAYHVLSPEQNRAINSGINTMLSILGKGDASSPQMPRFLRLSCWLTRIQLCEPDDLIVSGIVDDSLLASLSTSAHLVMGSSIALRRAVAPRRRRFGEDCSFQAWDDMLRAFTAVTESVRDETRVRQAPWMTVLSSRLLLMLWRTLRRAIGEIEQSKASGSESGQQHDGLGLASVLSSSVVDRIKQVLMAQNMEGTHVLEDHRAVEKAFIANVAELFTAIRTPVGEAISKIWREIATLMD